MADDGMPEGARGAGAAPAEAAGHAAAEPHRHPPLLSADGIAVAHGRRRVVEGVSLALAPGERVAVVGPNGAGKTSLLRALAGLARPAAGTVRLNGRDLTTLRERERARHIAFVAQDEHTDLPYRARDVLLLGRAAGRGDWHRYDTGDHAVVAEVAARWDLTDLLDRTLDALSGGERRRVLLARAFAQQADLLLLDEPTNHLDLRHQHALLAHLRDTGATAVLTLHDLDLAAAYCTRVVLLDRGRVLADGPPHESLSAGRVTEVYGVPAASVRIAGRARILIG
ncbi:MULTISPECIES: ABC transporter ATP-binding protein [Microbacterium]|uniref:ABC transporter ATP-binding protein n=1 Tax=Microbacterium TaxID=33882 RepID=UPI002784B8D1|nr:MULTISPECIES: ABC transporter ATP-binding protein [Microbacterium]MDQ1082231.1 iron complex transport system ATP-binding protein [Microbacterium sp. SORGH_AS_0344]MDQ1168998.1 iron complex transport system ATP-binding protein [Microbacterium proteolyticum]